MTTTLSAQYDPKAVEAGIYKTWLEANAFHAAPDGRANKFSMVIPPPNVTGALHLGHAINGTIQDILARYHRMKGDNTLWMPGIDHAGIATQAVVERTIFEKEKQSRHDLGREELVRRIWEWKEQFGTRILDQQAQLGASCDWERTRFTLDEVCARAVREAFFMMFRDGLIFRGKRLVNWDAQLQTAVADDEIYHETVKGQMTSIRYPVADENQESGNKNQEYLTVATTRPETMLGDTAVAVHPDDPRYAHLHGKFVIVPLVGRRIPIVTDGLLVDPAFGTGVVKVTPAHDPNDYATGVRHGLEQINLLTPDGKVNENGAGEFDGKKYSYVGLKFATAARKAVLADLEELGLIAEVKVHEHEVGHSDRSKTPIEPYMSDQWFVRMGDVAGNDERGTMNDERGGIALGDGTRVSGLAQAAMDAVKDGRVRITPERYAKGYLDWLGQKRDWCISRQLWWGHRIPVWSKVMDGTASVSSVSEASAVRVWADETTGRQRVYVCLAPGQDAWEKELEAAGFERDPDVLDTWFSSALWPISTMGWPAASNYASTWSRPKWEGENYTVAAVRAYFQKHVFLPALNNDEQQAAAAMERFACAYAGDQLDITFGDAAVENAVKATVTTMGYVRKSASSTPEPGLLDYFYPTSVLSTARDILTLWVARMVMFGLYCRGEVPFKDVYIHAVIQDGEGRTMSKSKGNGVDPVDIINSHGADALRFTLAQMATETQDIRMPVVKDAKTGVNTSPKFDIGRNFANKIWNASRYVLSNIDEAPGGSPGLSLSHIEDRWILSRLNRTIQTVEKAINGFHFSEAASALYGFFWTDLCDWYLEIAKARIRAGDAGVRVVLLECLETSLRLLHPVMPFVTEEIWSKLPGRQSLLVAAAWPVADGSREDKAAEGQIAVIQAVTSAIREIQNRYPAAKGKGVVIVPRDETTREAIERSRLVIEGLTGAAIVENGVGAAKPADAATAVLPEVQVFIGGVIDKAAEIAKLTKRQEELVKHTGSTRNKLGNEAAVAKVPAAVVQGWREALAKQEEELATVERNLAELRG